MKRTYFKAPIQDISQFRSWKQKVLNWVRPFSTFCFLDNQEYKLGPHSYECLVGAGILQEITGDTTEVLSQLNSSANWWMGHLGFELPTNTVGPVTRKFPDRSGFSNLYFFEPAIVIKISENSISIFAENPEMVFEEIMQTEIAAPSGIAITDVQCRISKEEYLHKIQQLKAHIQRGDCYEINFCQEFFAENSQIDPVAVFERLCEVSPNPFAALYHVQDSWLLCASPERFLHKKGKRIISQPIKGTSPRNLSSAAEDAEAKAGLQQSAKDRAENVMVVDLVRNDLARICEEGTVKVDELFGVYSFPQVFQMISTISGELSPQISFKETIEALFPMGSMTGAPKKRVVELINQYEESARGIFSGTVGYIDPAGDYDFNVVIRSIIYNAQSHYLSFPAGSGITIYSDPQKEWEECLLKAKAIKQVLGAE